MAPEGGTSDSRRWPREVVLLVVALVVTVAGAAGQEIRGQVVDQSNGTPVPLAGVYLLDRDHEVVTAALADEQGRYVLSVPEGGDYYLKVQRLGYFETESPLLEVSAGRDYDVELGVRPEPIRIEGLEVEVEAEKQNSWAKERLRFMDPRWGWGDPSASFGFRVITGVRLEEAKLRAKDSLDLLRWVYVPIYNSAVGMCVQMRPTFNRGGGVRAMGVHDTPAPVPQCGNIFLDGMPLEPEHVESIDFRSITGVMVIPPTLHLMTVDFERRFRERSVR